MTALCLQVLVVPMLAPRSYTREDVIELQCHGSEVCIRRVLRACLEAGARLAEPGDLRFWPQNRRPNKTFLFLDFFFPSREIATSSKAYCF